MATNQYRQIAYSRYRDLVAADYQRFAQVYDRLLTPHIRVEKNWRCLDVACGNGNFLAFLRSKGVENYLGVDITASAVARASQEFGSNRIINQPVDAFLRANSVKYHFISALDFVEHIKKDELVVFLGIVADKLDDDGYLLVRTPNASAPFGMAARYNDVTHEICFTCDSLGEFALRFGFSVVAWWDDVGAPRSLLQACHWALWKLVSALYKTLDFIEMGSWSHAPMTRNFWILLQRTSRAPSDKRP